MNLFFIHLVGRPVRKARAFWVNVKKTWQLVVKIKSDPLVNKQSGVQLKGEFLEEQRWLDASDW